MVHDEILEIRKQNWLLRLTIAQFVVLFSGDIVDVYWKILNSKRVKRVYSRAIWQYDMKSVLY